MMQRKKKIKVALNKELVAEMEKATFKDVAVLTKILSERGRILSRERSGLSAKMQRKAANLIKRARQLGLLAFVNEL